MSLAMPWMALSCHAIFSGLCGQRIIPSGVLMHGKVVGFNLTDVATWPLLEWNNFSTPSVWTQHDPGGQLHVRRWVSRLGTGQGSLTSIDSEGTKMEASSVASDQDRFDAAYEAFRDLSEGLHDIDTREARRVTSDDAPGIVLSDGQVQLRELVHLPRNWPLARLTIPLRGLSKQVDRLLEGYCFQILAEYLADTIAWLMRSILDHESKILFDTDTEPLLTPGFWILPLYRELLNSASRNRPSPSIRESPW